MPYKLDYLNSNTKDISLLSCFVKESNKIEKLERFAFYERAKNAFAVIATGEEAIYANLIIKKGVIK